MIDGLPGSGKTTFVKRICYLWAQKLKKRAGEEKFERLEDYTLVVPIILKFVKYENTLTEILTTQLPCLNICEVCALLRHQQTNPRDTLLLLDGYDEYTGKSFIENVILRNKSPDVVCITTSRAHAIEQIKRHSSRAVDQHVRMCGFNEDQIKQYVKQFCEFYNLPLQKGTNLIEVLKEKHHLLEVAKLPIRTEMICVVWAVYGRLGDTLTDLYEKFILHLIKHWDEKLPTSNQFSKLSQDNIWKSSQPLLLKVGKLANTWTTHNNLCSTYNDKELEDVLEEDYEKVINIGLLIKSYPSSALNVSKWSFPHMTFQEYFIAYFLGNVTSDKEVTDFTKRCKQYQYRVLIKCEVIFTFLASMYPATASKIITCLLLEERDKTRCEELFDILSKQFENIVNQRMDIPLPFYLNLDSNKKINLIFLQALFDADQKREKSNLRQLRIDNPLKFAKFLDILVIKELCLTVLNEQQFKLVSQKIKHLRQLTSFSIKSAVGFSSWDQEDIIKNTEEKTLKYLSITGPGALEAVAKNIDKFVSLEKLQVEENSDIRGKTHGQKILETLKSNKSVKQVNFSVMDLNDIIIKEDVEIKVVVRVKKLKPGTLKATSDMLRGDTTLALHTLDLSRNSLEHEGRPLGELVAKVSGLRVLILDDCNLVAKTVQEMVDVFKLLHLPDLQTLNMGQCENNNSNNLHSAGSVLGKLLKVMPDLQILDLAECKLQAKDFEALSQALSAASTNIHSTTKIHTLNLCVNDLGDTSEKGFTFLQHLPELKALKAGGPDDDPIPAICEALDNGFITKLCTLDVSDSSVQSESLRILGEHLYLMKSLEVLNLKGIEEVEVADYNHIYKNIPPSLTHLNVSSEHTMTNKPTDPYDILDNKYCFSKLLNLNVTLIESDQEMLQELLEKINPDTKVYCNPKENIWKIYVLDKTVT